MPNTENPPQATGQTLMEWSANTKVTQERGHRWYVAAGTIALLLVAYGILFGGIVFSVVVILMVGLYVYVHNHQLPQSRIVISDVGVALNGKFTPWSDFENFGFVTTPQYAEIRFTKKKRGGDVAIHIDGQDPAQIRAAVSPYLVEQTNKTESLLDTLIRFCKL